MMRTVSLLMAAGLLVAMTSACQSTRPDRDYVQTNVVDKDLFQGEWYYIRTVVDNDYESWWMGYYGTFTGDASAGGHALPCSGANLSTYLPSIDGVHRPPPCQQRGALPHRSQSTTEAAAASVPRRRDPCSSPCCRPHYRACVTQTGLDHACSPSSWSRCT